MEMLKTEALNAILKLSETAAIEDMMYRLYVIDKVRKGQDAIKRGDSLPAKDLLDEINSWLFSHSWLEVIWNIFEYNDKRDFSLDYYIS